MYQQYTTDNVLSEEGRHTLLSRLSRRCWAIIEGTAGNATLGKKKGLLIFQVTERNDLVASTPETGTLKGRDVALQ